MHNLCPHMVPGGCEPCRRDHAIWMGKARPSDTVGISGSLLPAVPVPAWYEVAANATAAEGLRALKAGVARLGWRPARGLGKLAQHLPELVRVRALVRLAETIGYSLATWEEMPGRATSDVFALLNRAIEAADGQGRAA